jgi:hypothetical protein
LRNQFYINCSKKGKVNAYKFDGTVLSIRTCVSSRHALVCFGYFGKVNPYHRYSGKVQLVPYLG